MSSSVGSRLDVLDLIASGGSLVGQTLRRLDLSQAEREGGQEVGGSQGGDGPACRLISLRSDGAAGSHDDDLAHGSLALS